MFVGGECRREKQQVDEVLQRGAPDIMDPTISSFYHFCKKANWI